MRSLRELEELGKQEQLTHAAPLLERIEAEGERIRTAIDQLSVANEKRHAA